MLLCLSALLDPLEVQKNASAALRANLLSDSFSDSSPFVLLFF